MVKYNPKTQNLLDAKTVFITIIAKTILINIQKLKSYNISNQFSEEKKFVKQRILSMSILKRNDLHV
jgi:hypothetical protein